MARPPSNGYPALLKLIRSEISAAQDRIEKTRVRAYWKVGEHIYKYELKQNGRAGYGESLYKSLARDLDLGERVLYQSVQFYKEFPKLHPGAKLPWSHYRALLTVHDKMIRNRLMKTAAKEGLTKRELEEQISVFRRKQEAGRGKPHLPSSERSGLPSSILTPVKPGQLYMYQLITPTTFTPVRGYSVVDCGFNFWVQVKRSEHPEATFVTTRKEMSFTYRAYVEEVIDGDTLWLHIDLGFGNMTRHKVRLRGIDAPELAKSGGQRAKRFVQRALSNEQLATSNEILIRSSKSDRYDRYLADVFYGKDETYLNQQLLDEGLAVGYKE